MSSDPDIPEDAPTTRNLPTSGDLATPMLADPRIVEEWRAAMRRGRDRTRKGFFRELFVMLVGTATFYAVLVASLFVVAKLFERFVSRELDHVAFVDNARTFTVLIGGPIFLILAPFSAAAFVMKLLRRRK